MQPRGSQNGSEPHRQGRGSKAQAQQIVRSLAADELSWCPDFRRAKSTVRAFAARLELRPPSSLRPSRRRDCACATSAMTIVKDEALSVAELPETQTKHARGLFP